MDKNDFFRLCWKHYLVLEADLMNVERYVSFESGNYSSYSVEFIKQYQAISSELDVVCKVYCKVINNTSTVNDIMDYAHIILNHIPNIKNAKVMCNEIEIEPLKEWSTNPHNHRDGNDPLNNSPIWWKMYNKVKHNRVELDSQGEPYYKQANLKNTLYALAGLFVICMNCYKELCDKVGESMKLPLEPSKLFTYKDWEPGTIVLPGGVYMTY